MKLSDLEPRFLRTTEKEGVAQFVDSLEEAQGIFFVCPECTRRLGTTVGAHGITCYSSSRGVGPDRSDLAGPGRWTLLGTGYTDLTLGPEPGRSNSVLLTSEGGCKAHFFVEQGDIRFC